MDTNGHESFHDQEKAGQKNIPEYPGISRNIPDGRNGLVDQDVSENEEEDLLAPPPYLADP
jgi:hypothetical protein